MTLTELDLQAVREAFDRAAESYDRHAVLQHQVEQELLERVAYFELSPDAVLDLGCGTGIGTSVLTERYPGTGVIGLDWSQGMLGQARRRTAEVAMQVCADMCRLPFTARSFDLVFSNLAIQWSPDTAGLYAEVRRVLKPGGLFLFTTFGPETLIELRTAWSQVDDLPHVNDFADIMSVGDQLVAAGFQDPVLDVDRMTLQYRDAMTLMRELKAIGAHNSAVARPTGLTGKGKLQAVLSAYESFRDNGHYPASYEVVYGATFAPAEGQPVRTPEGEEAVFSVDSLLRGRSGP